MNPPDDAYRTGDVQRTDAVHRTVPGANDPTQPLRPDQSLGELLGELTSEFSTLIRDEVQLAKVELKAEAKDAGKAGGLLGAAAVAGLMALILLSFAIAWGLAEIMPAGWAFALVGLLYLIAAAVMGLAGKKKLDEVNPTPEQTVQTLKEDVKWAKKQIN